MPPPSSSSPRAPGSPVECCNEPRRSPDSGVEPVGERAVSARRSNDGLEASRAVRLAQLARRAGNGDTEAEAQIVRVCMAQAFALAASKMRDRETAREVANDAMLALLLALRKRLVRDLDRLEAFVYGITIHLVHNRLRRERTRLETVAIENEPGGEDPWSQHERMDQIRQVQKVLRRLEPVDRRILSLTLVEGLKPTEIAARLDMSTDVVRQRKCRALKEMVSSIGASREPRTGSPPGASPR